MKQKILSIVLVVVLIFTIWALPAMQQPADAVAVATVVIAAVIAAMAVWGISTVVAGMTSAQIESWVEGKLNDWASSEGSSVSSLIPVSGITSTVSGLLVLGVAAANGIKSFVNWLHADESLSAGVTTTVMQENASFLGKTCSHVDAFSYQYVETYANSNKFTLKMFSTGPIYCYYCTNGSTYEVAFMSASAFLIETIEESFSPNNEPTIRRTTTESIQNSYGYYHRYVTAIPVNVVNAPESNSPPDIVLQTSLDVPATQYQENEVNPGKSLMLDTDVSYNLPADLTGSESLYLNTGAAIGSTLEGITEHIMTDAAANTLTASGEISESVPEYEVEGPIAVPGLPDVFPFCIPFDLYNLVSKLSAEPEAPSFQWRFYVPGICDEVITIDLSGFNTVAQILRTMLIILFCVGLAFETRKLLRS